MDYPALRRQRLHQCLDEEQLDVLLITNPINVSYLTGFLNIGGCERRVNQTISYFSRISLLILTAWKSMFTSSAEPKQRAPGVLNGIA